MKSNAYRRAVSLALVMSVAAGGASVAGCSRQHAQTATSATANASDGDASQALRDDTSTQAPSELADHAPAGTAVAGTPVLAAGSPFDVTACTGVLTMSPGDDGKPELKLWVSATIHNLRDRPLASTSVAIAASDAHGPIADDEDHFGTFDDDDEEPIAPNASYDSTGTFERPSPAMTSIACAPAKATFADGARWTRAAR